METSNTATEEKLLAVFDLMRKLNTWFDCLLKKKKSKCQLSGFRNLRPVIIVSK